MGCNQSRIENEEAVSRCKDRKLYMKLSVSARNAFAAAHSGYAVSIKNTGAALSDYGHAELQTTASSAHATQPTSSAATTVPLETFHPPPPPPKDLQPLQRAATMPEMTHKVVANKPMSPTIEEEEDEMMDVDKQELVRKRSGRSRSKRVADDDDAAARLQKERQHQMEELERRQPPPAPAPQNDSTWDYFFNMENMPGPSLAEVAEHPEVKVNKEEIDRKVFDEMIDKEEEEVVLPEMPVQEKVEEVPVVEEMAVATGKVVKKGKTGMGTGPPGVGESKLGRMNMNLNLIKIFEELDDHFLKASESAHEVSKMLEATRLHYHSNFADNRGKSAFF